MDGGCRIGRKTGRLTWIGGNEARKLGTPKQLSICTGRAFGDGKGRGQRSRNVIWAAQPCQCRPRAEMEQDWQADKAEGEALRSLGP